MPAKTKAKINEIRYGSSSFVKKHKTDKSCNHGHFTLRKIGDIRGFEDQHNPQSRESIDAAKNKTAHNELKHMRPSRLSLTLLPCPVR